MVTKILANHDGPRQEAADAVPGHSAPSDGPAAVTPEQRYQRIAEGAYLRAAARGFAGGDPLLDWLEAERAFDASADQGSATGR